MKENLYVPLEIEEESNCETKFEIDEEIAETSPMRPKRSSHHMISNQD